MTILEFMALGLIHGHKYTVTFKNPATDKPEKETLFFNGYSCYAGKNVVRNNNDIVPVFNLPTKNGKMSRNQFVKFTTRAEEILEVETGDDTETIGYDETFQHALDAIEKRSRNQLLAIVREMDHLFPGKKILLDPDDRVCSVRYYKYDCTSTEINAIWINNGKVVLDVEGNDDNDNGVPFVSVDPNSYAELLQNVMQNILYPYMGENSFVDENTRYEDIPEPEPNSILARTECILMLKCHYWFRQLPFQKKQEIISRYKKDASYYNDDYSADMTFLFELQDIQKQILYSNRNNI